MSKEVRVYITHDLDDWQEEDIEDAVYAAVSRHLNKHDFTITVWEVD